MILFHESGDVAAPARYNECFAQLKDWVEKSLDRYKMELMAVLYPLYVHCVLDLLEKGFPEEAGVFLHKYKSFAGDHVDVLNKLKVRVGCARYRMFNALT
jgi:transcription initiation factor TFIID subunit 5